MDAQTPDGSPVFARVQSVIAEVLKVDPARIAESTAFEEVTVVDSLTLAEIATALDHEFQIRIPTEAISEARTARELVRVVQELTQGAARAG
jgi:acyl carrier protein